MIVELKPHIMIGMRSRQPVDMGQYQILVDGLLAGYVAYKPGSRACLIKRFGPIERKEIETKVGELREEEPTESAQVPEVPPEYRDKINNADGGITADDLD